MGNELWQQVRLGDIVSVKHGWPFKSELFSEELTGRPIVVAVGNFRYTGGFRFDSTTIKEYRGDYPTGFQLAPGDVLLVMTCQTSGGEILGIPARIPDDGRQYLHNQRLGKIEVKRPGRVDLNYLYWVFLSKPFNRELCASATGTKIVHTAPNRIEAYTFALPPIGEQRAIANVLSSLDAKVELNRQRARTLEAAARAIFQKWFVDIDTSRAGVTGGPPPCASPEFGALVADGPIGTAAGAPQADWQLGTIGEVVDLSRETIAPSDFPDEQFEHYSIPAFDAGRLPAIEVGSTIKSQKFIIDARCVLVSKLNPKTPRVWIPAKSDSRRQISSTEFLVCRPRSGFGKSFVYGLTSSDAFAQYLTTHASGTSNSHQRVRPADFLAYHLPLPPPRAVQEYERIAAPLLESAAAGLAENTTLAALRDALLPKLISGELRVLHTK